MNRLFLPVVLSLLVGGCKESDNSPKVIMGTDTAAAAVEPALSVSGGLGPSPQKKTRTTSPGNTKPASTAPAKSEGPEKKEATRNPATPPEKKDVTEKKDETVKSKEQPAKSPPGKESLPPRN